MNTTKSAEEAAQEMLSNFCGTKHIVGKLSKDYGITHAKATKIVDGVIDRISINSSVELRNRIIANSARVIAIYQEALETSAAKGELGKVVAIAERIHRVGADLGRLMLPRTEIQVQTQTDPQGAIDAAWGGDSE
jgi:hypothetical protein